MKILTVIPLTKSPVINELTYFSVREAPLGSVVEISLRNKPVLGLVINAQEATDLKAMLRGNDFQLKKIGGAPPYRLTTSAFVKAVEHTALYHGASIGTVVYSLIPKPILDHISKSGSGLILKSPGASKNDAVLNAKTYQSLALQAPYAERLSTYKNIVRESFAKKESIIITAPNPRKVRQIVAALEHGIAKYVIPLCSGMTKKKVIDSWQKTESEKHPIVIVTTPSYLQNSRRDIGTIIIESQSSDAYKQLSRPFIDTRIFIKEYAKKSNAKLIYADTVLSAEISRDLQKGSIDELSPLTTKDRSPVKVHIINTGKKKENPEDVQKIKKKEEFSTISPQVQAVLTTALLDKKSICILAPRRGLAPITVCRDCREPVRCDTCDTTVTLHKHKDGRREFLCNKCGESKETDTTCSACDSWRLDTLGIGIELVEEELQKKYPKVTFVKIDKQTCKTEKAIKEKINEFLEPVTGKNSKQKILLGTQLLLDYVEMVDITLIASLDAMLSVPDFSIDESVFKLLLQMKEKTREDMYIQTRVPEREVLLSVQNGTIAQFMREELKLRKMLHYPPYTTMIRVTKSGSKKQIVDAYTAMLPLLKPYGPRVFKEFERVRSNVFALHCLLRVESEEWPHHELVEILREIQPTFEVRVNVSG